MKEIYIDGKNDFFASANTRYGFYSLFDEVFDRKKFEKVYIIKGGSGTGKSSLMKKVREKCDSEGMKTQGVLCSSDPISLDGLTVGGNIAAFIDGTSPHTTDPVYPGAVDNIINLGEFWNEELIRKNRNVLITLDEKKKQSISRAYKYLKAAGDIADDTLNIISQNFDFGKMKKAILRFFDNEFGKNGVFTQKKCFTTCFNRNGYGRSLFFENMSCRRCIVENDRGSYSYFFEEMLSEARKRDIPVIVSYDCFDPGKADGLYFPDESLCVTRCSDRDKYRCVAGEPYRIFNMERFISCDTLRRNKEKLRFGNKCSDELMHASSESFDEAFSIHSETESIYISAMDFFEKERFTAELVKEFETFLESRKND